MVFPPQRKKNGGGYASSGAGGNIVQILSSWLNGMKGSQFWLWLRTENHPAAPLATGKRLGFTGGMTQ